MDMNEYMDTFNPYSLLSTLQSEDENCKLELELLQDLIDKIDSEAEPIQIKNDLEDFVVQIVHDYFARGMKVGAQMYVALTENLEEEI